MDFTPIPFRVAIPVTTIQSILARVRGFPFDRLRPPTENSWLLGTNPSYLRDFCAFWSSCYDWSRQQLLINTAAQHIVEIEGVPVHFVCELGSGTRPQPLLIMHGWPYSFYSYTPLIDRLAHPERHGGNIEEAFTVVIPSLPGYAFSGVPSEPIGPRKVTRIFNTLMQELGLAGYIAHGGDWGGYMASLAGLDYPQHVAGVHTTFLALREESAPLQTGNVSKDASQEEQAFVAREFALWKEQGAYAQVQSTKPLALATALLDNAVGVAAWIIDKFYAWSDQRQRPFASLFSYDQLITEIMLYLVTDAFQTSIWIYAGQKTEGPVLLKPDQRVEVPTAIAAFPDPVFPMPPRAVAERTHNVVRYTEMSHGGHFPFYEAPELLIRDLQKFAQTLRT